MGLNLPVLSFYALPCCIFLYHLSMDRCARKKDPGGHDHTIKHDDEGLKISSVKPKQIGESDQLEEYVLIKLVTNCPTPNHERPLP